MQFRCFHPTCRKMWLIWHCFLVPIVGILSRGDINAAEAQRRHWDFLQCTSGYSIGKVSLIPSNATAPENTEVVFRCDLEAPLNETVDIVWKFEPVNGTVQTLSNTSSDYTIYGQRTLVIKSFSEQHVGNYYCQVCDCSTDCEKKSEATLLKLPPEVNQESGISEKVIEGTTATLPCRHFGRPTPEVRWLKGGYPITLDGTKFTVPPGSQSLVISNLTTIDESIYSCLVENKYGRKSVDITLVVVGSTRFTKVQKEYKVPKGGNITLSCEAKTSQIVNVKLALRNNNPMKNESFKVCPRSSNNKNDSNKILCRVDLHLKNVQQSQNYSCVESLQSKEYSILVTVMNRPEPPKLEVVRCDNSNHNVELRWSPGNSNNSPLKNYTVRKRLVKGFDVAWQMSSILESNFDSTIIKLRPNTETEFQVISSNTVGNSKPSNSVKCLIKPTVPFKNPPFVLSNCIKEITRTVVVTWTPLTPEDYNGPGCVYEVSIPALNRYVLIPHCGTSSHTFSGLPIQENYKVTIRAKNTIGKSSAEASEITVCDNKGRVEPHKLRATVDGHDMKPFTEFQRGNPVVLECTADGNPRPSIWWLRNGKIVGNSPKIKFENRGSRVLVINNPQRATKFSCFANNTECAIMHNCTNATLEIREQFIPPPQVTNLKVLALSPNSIYVQWRRPPQMLYITGFEVIVSDNSGEVASRNYTVPPTTKVAKINGLTPTKKYVVTIITIYEDGRRSEPLNYTYELKESLERLTVNEPKLQWRWRYDHNEKSMRLFVYWLPDERIRNDEAPASGFRVEITEIGTEEFSDDVQTELDQECNLADCFTFHFEFESSQESKAFRLHMTGGSGHSGMNNEALQTYNHITLLQPGPYIRHPRLLLLTAAQQQVFTSSDSMLLQNLDNVSNHSTVPFCRPAQPDVVKCFGKFHAFNHPKGPDVQGNPASFVVLSPNNDLLLWSTQNGRILITNLENGFTQTILQTVDKISYLVADWFNGSVYWVGNGSMVVKLQLDGEIPASSPVLLPTSESEKIGLSVDSLHKLVYIATETSIFEYAGETESLPLLTLPDKLKIVPGTLNWFQNRLFWINRVLREPQPETESEPQPEAETFTLSIFDFDTGSWDQKFIHVGSLPLRAQIYEDQPLPSFSKCPNCSHSCIPRGNGKFECVCPFGLGLSAENRCEGLRIGLTLFDENVLESFSIMAVDIGNVSNPSFQLQLQDSRLISANPGFVQGGTENYCIYARDEGIETCIGVFERITTTRFFRPPSNLVMDEILFSSISGVNSSVVLWYKLGPCIKRYDSERNESLTIYCNDQMDFKNTVIDAHNWIVFWRNKQTGNILKTELAYEVESPIIFRDEFNELNRTFRITCDPSNKVVYWLSARHLNARGYDQGGSRKQMLRSFVHSGSNLVFNQGLIYWNERTDSHKLIVMDLVTLRKSTNELISKHELFSRTRTIPRVFPLFRETVSRSDSSSIFCSHFRTADNVCWCPAEYPLLLNGTNCAKVHYLIAVAPVDSAYDMDDGEFSLMNVDSTLELTKTVYLDTRIAGTRPSAHFAANRDHSRICWQTFSDSYSIKCNMSEKQFSLELNASSPASAFHVDDRNVYSDNEPDSCMLIQSISKPEENIKAHCQRMATDTDISIDPVNKLVFWCVVKGGDSYLKFQSMDGGVAPTEIPLSSSNTCQKDGAMCRSIAIDECRRQVYIVHGSQIKRVGYADLFHVTVEPQAVIDLGTSYATSLQYYQNRLFWIGGTGQIGEYIETLTLPDPSMILQGQRVPHRYEIEKELKLIQMSVQKSLPESHQCYTDPCQSSNCEYFCFPATWNSDKSRCYCPTEDACDTKFSPETCECFDGDPSWLASQRSSPWIWVGVVALLTVIAITLVILMFDQKRRHRREMQEVVAKFFKGTPEALSKATNGAELAQFKPFVSSVKSTDIVVHLSERLGGGEFGNVYKATYRGQNSAVKTMKPGSPLTEFEGFLKEIKIMTYIGEHENIVKFYGAQVDHINAGNVFAVLELSPFGDLEGTLRRSKTNNYVNPISSDSCGDESAEPGPIPYRTMLHWCYQIANGLEFMVSKDVIHGDVATRNVLVFKDNVVKISDFGFSRYTCGKLNYVKCKKLAYRWAAIETLEFCEFSHRADVWSFGVTCWEIFSLGLTPFANQSFTVDFPKMIREGLRLPKPEYATNETYKNLIMPCWNLDPEQRPSFTIIKAIIQRFSKCSATIRQAGKNENVYE